MPKLKTHKGASKRFKKTGHGQGGSQSRLWPAHPDLEAAQAQEESCIRAWWPIRPISRF